MDNNYKWYVGLMHDGTYRFITPDNLHQAQKYIGQNGGAVFTYAGYMVFASNRRWYDFVMVPYMQKYRFHTIDKRPPHLDFSEIDCSFSEAALKWLEDNEEKLKEIGGKVYDNIPRESL